MHDAAAHGTGRREHHDPSRLRKLERDRHRFFHRRRIVYGNHVVQRLSYEHLGFTNRHNRLPASTQRRPQQPKVTPLVLAADDRHDAARKALD